MFYLGNKLKMRLQTIVILFYVEISDVSKSFFSIELVLVNVNDFNYNKNKNPTVIIAIGF